MKLYEIPNELEALIDPETGEVTDADRFIELTNRFENGKEWLALMYKNYLSDAEALKKEKDTFAVRERVAKNKAESVKHYLDYLCGGQKFSTDKVAVTYRKSTVVEVSDDFVSKAIGDENLERYLKYKEPEVDKTAIKEAIKQGFVIDNARLVEKNNIQIK